MWWQTEKYNENIQAGGANKRIKEQTSLAISLCLPQWWPEMHILQSVLDFKTTESQKVRTPKENMIE